MFLSFLKILSTVGLLIGLVVFVTNREIIFTQSNKAIVKTSDTQGIVPPKEPEIMVQAPTKQTVDSAANTHIAPVVPIKATPKVPATTTKIAVMPRKSTYVSIDEGTPDTVVTYKPSISPCKVTMGYTIGTFDTHFGISKDTFISEINKASSLWGDQVGKTLFTYNQNGPLIINLIYDERQARTDTVNNLVLEIENSKATAETIKNTYETEKTIYLGDAEQYSKDGAAFTARYDAYKDKVDMYNNQGGAPADIYNQLNQELQYLKEESKSLEERRISLAAYIDTINAKVNRYNELVVYINSLITKSNEVGGNTFTEGRFTPSTKTVDIYQFNNMLKLRRVVTHELGHVLGINHNDNVYSIMYSSNSATTTVLSDEDIQALFKVCPKN